MVLTSTAGKKRRRILTKIESLDNDVLCVIFSFLDILDVVRCTVVCKSWNAIINRFKLLQVLCCKLQQDSSSFSNTSNSSQQSSEIDLERLAIKQHRSALQKGRIDIDQWKGHSVGVDMCRMKMGLVLTGVGDKVMRLWSLDSYKSVENYSIPETLPLVDFDFDESKIVGLVGTHICIWRRNGKRSIFPSYEGTRAKALCMRYNDHEAVVGYGDGAVGVFDMDSTKCCQRIRMHPERVTCLSLGDNKLILSGSSNGCVTLSNPLSNEHVVTLPSRGSKGGIRSLCFNPSSLLVFAGTTFGYISCWDLRGNRKLWERPVSPNKTNVINSLELLRNDTSILAVGGNDGVLRFLNQRTGITVSSCVADDKMPPSSSRNGRVIINRKKGRFLDSDGICRTIPRSARPPITCLAVGMKKVITTHKDEHISIWKFNK